ncbi:MAG: DMT family transporter [Actinomycetota bacterium]|nr:DMT family transporter [Actinomycetota bacterium]MDP2287951.1 DMT family transporter [Actinomycetota bacterium]
MQLIHPRFPILIPAVVSVIVGALTSLQARMNGELSQDMGNSLGAAAWSFTSGLLIMCLVLLFSSRVRAGVLRVPSLIRSGTLRWWQILGGILGGFFVAVQAGAVPLIGVAVFTIAVVAGQSSTSLVVDRLGMGPAGVQPITVRRVISALIAVVAVWLAVGQRLGDGSIPILPVVMAFIAGLTFSVQAAYNGRVSFSVGVPLAATFLNFVFGWVVLGAALGFGWLALDSGISSFFGAPWWAYLGGFIGIAFITISALTVPLVGVLLFALLSITGQLIGSMALDIFAPVAGAEVTLGLVLGVLLAFVSVAVAASNRTRPLGTQ